MEYSSTGVNVLLSGKSKEAIIFSDNGCPHCESVLEIEIKKLKQNDYRIRYICKNCGFICPIQYNGENLKITTPAYDSSIRDFIFNFGEEISEKIKKLGEKTDGQRRD